MFRLRSLIFITATLAATPSFAASEYAIGFGPLVGGGTITGGSNVRHSSGYAATAERGFQITEAISIGPRVEFLNSFVNAKAKDGDTTRISTYDNRIFAAGFSLRHRVGSGSTLFQSAYLNGMAGRGYSKLTVDHSTEKTYVQNLYGQIKGTYYSTELGSFIPLKNDFGFSFGILASAYKADQSDSTGTYAGDEVGEDGNIYLTEGSQTAREGGMPRQVWIKTVSAHLGLVFGF